MRIVLSVLVVGALAAGLRAAEGTTYGAGVTIKEATPIETLLANPDAYTGKKVRVDGVVSAVCEEMGCWIELSDPKLGKGLRFKVEDGVIVFPISAKGKRASAEGTFEKIDLAKASEHQTADLKADPKAATTVTYLVRATGAIVY
jgi:hypothetical protein